MKYCSLYWICFLVFSSSSTLYSQKNKTFRSLDEANANPDSVYSLVITMEEYKDYCAQVGNPEYNEIPKEVFKFKNLEYLKVSGSNIVSIPKSIKKLKHLKQLELNWNNISKIPKSISNLENLTVLRLKHNKLVSIPEHLKNLKKLELLDFSNNLLENIPDYFADFECLESVDFSNNRLKSFPAFKSTKYVNLNSNLIESIPKFQSNNNVLKLNLAHNKLSSLPNSIKILKNLVELDISHNLIKEFPFELDSLFELRTLRLSGLNFSGSEAMTMETPFNLIRVNESVKLKYETNLANTFGSQKDTIEFQQKIKYNNRYLLLKIKSNLYFGLIDRNLNEINILENVLCRDKLNRAHAKNKSLFRMIGESIKPTKEFVWSHNYSSKIIEYIIVDNPYYPKEDNRYISHKVPSQYLITFTSLGSKNNLLEILDVFEVFGKIPI